MASTRIRSLRELPDSKIALYVADAVGSAICCCLSRRDLYMHPVSIRRIGFVSMHACSAADMP